jgi:hypothetical protein
MIVLFGRGGIMGGLAALQQRLPRKQGADGAA